MPTPRETFYDAQARHRRAARRWALACALPALAFAVATSFVLTPVLLIAGALVARAVHVVVPIPAAFWGFLHATAATLATGMRAAFNGETSAAIEIAEAGRALGLLLLPGVFSVLVVWRVLRRVLLRDGGLGIAQAIGARPPRTDDLEERQLVNVAEEMALAAGVAPLRVSLVDAGSPNVAASGVSAENATIMVTRETLAALDREQTQAVVGHVVGSIVNGDLKLGLEALAVAQTFGFFSTLLEAPLNASARARVRLFAHAIGPRHLDAAERANLVAGLCAGLDPDTIGESGKFLDDLDRPGTPAGKSFLLHVRAVLLLPLFGIVLVAKLFLLVATLLVVVPFVGWMLRHRRYLADASAVELTRNPDALARALATLAPASHARGGHWAPQLFVVMPHGAALSIAVATPLLLIGAHPPIAGRLKRLGLQGAIATTVPRAAARRRRLLGLPPLPDVGPVLKVVTVALTALILTPLVAFITYLSSVALLFAVGAAAGAYWVALWVVLRIAP